MTRTVAVARDLGAFLDTAWVQLGLGDYTADSTAGGIGAAIVVVNLAALVAAIAIAVPRLRAGRRAFWVPLAAGVLCTTTTSGLLLVAAAADPGFATLMQP